MSAILIGTAVLWIAWNVAYIVRGHGQDDVRFLKAARGWDK